MVTDATSHDEHQQKTGSPSKERQTMIDLIVVQDLVDTRCSEVARVARLPTGWRGCMQRAPLLGKSSRHTTSYPISVISTLRTAREGAEGKRAGSMEEDRKFNRK